MNREIIETLIYKGLEIETARDDDSESPDKWEDDGVFLVAFHRDFSVEREGYSKGLVSSIFNNGRYEDDSINYEAREVMKKYHIFGLEAYIHSGVTLALSKEGNFVDRQWDVSQLGCVFIVKKETKTRPKARKLARCLINTWNEYLHGEVYGYNSDAGGCWGFYGEEGYKQMIDEAKSEIDSYVADKLSKHNKQLKAQIKRGVPIDKRQAFTL